jgi:mannose-1-phosphate guanylyltransferase
MIAQVLPIRPRLHDAPALSRHLWGIVLAGGDAEPTPLASARIARRVGRPVTRLARGLRPVLFRQAVERASRLIAPRRLVAVLSRADVSDYAPELVDLPAIDCVTQPVYRGSAAEIFLPVLKIAHQDPHAVVVVLPSHQLVDYEARFMNYVSRAVAAVTLRPDLPVVIGARPHGPDPACTWIEPGDAVDGLEGLAVRAVKRFVHRPSLAEAEALYEGDGLLSTLVIIGTARRLLELGRRYLPDVLETLEPLESAFGTPEEALLCEAVYEGMPYASISRDLLERGGDFAVLPIPDVMWRDCAQPVLATALAS